MDKKAIPRLDRAALNLIEVLDTYTEDLKPYLETNYLTNLREQVVGLRRELLGLEMGVLYQDWDTPADVLTQMVTDTVVPVEEAAAQVIEILNHQQKGEAKE